MPDRLNASQQENLLTLLAHSDEHGKIIAQIVNPQLFEGDYRTLAERIVDYWRKHKTAPKIHTPDLVGEILDDPHNRRAQTFRRIIGAMVELSASNINVEYVLKTLAEFTQVQQMKAAVSRSAELLSNLNPDPEQIKAVFQDLVTTRDLHFDAGVDLLDIERMLTFGDKQALEFRTGIDAFDRAGIVPTRKTMMLFLAPKGFGKSWWLVHLAKHAMMMRKRILYVSNEMQEELVQQRMFQSLFSLTRRDEEDIALPILRLNKFGDVTGLGTEQHTPDFTFENPDVRTELETRIKLWGHRFFQNMRIKRWAPRVLTPPILRAYLDSLEATQSFVPDLLLVDNIGNMKTDERNHRITLGRAFEEITGIAIARNMACVATHQVSRAGMKAERVSSGHISEDITMVHTADFVVTYSATEAERVNGLARLYVENARSEADKFGVVVTQNYLTGQFALQSARLSPRYYDLTDELKKQLSTSEQEDDE